MQRLVSPPQSARRTNHPRDFYDDDKVHTEVGGSVFRVRRAFVLSWPHECRPMKSDNSFGVMLSGAWARGAVLHENVVEASVWALVWGQKASQDFGF